MADLVKGRMTRGRVSTGGEGGGESSSKKDQEKKSALSQGGGGTEKGKGGKKQKKTKGDANTNRFVVSVCLGVGVRGYRACGCVRVRVGVHVSGVFLGVFVGWSVQGGKDS